MANVFIQDSTMTAIGDAIRAKTGGTDKLLPADMAAAIEGITTGGGGGGDGISMGVTTITTFSGGPSFNSSNPIKGSIYMTIPEEAIVEHAYVSATVTGSSTTTMATLGTISGGTPCEFTEGTPDMYNNKKMTLVDYSISNPSALMSKAWYNANFAVIKLPNAYMKDNILYATENCKSLLPVSDNSLGKSGQRDPLYYEGINLKGSQVKRIQQIGRGHSEFKKLWFSEVYDFSNSSDLSYCKGQLEEVHFTATTPLTVSSSFFSGLVNTCKIYVPAGTLSAYTSAKNYPSASTYTYIEE